MVRIDERRGGHSTPEWPATRNNPVAEPSIKIFRELGVAAAHVPSTMAART